ncbi:MAG: hypothetical protein AAFV25_27535 [Bacteroidota bacterium]
MPKLHRVSTSTDAYQESHLISPSAGWPRGMYLLLALFTGAMAFGLFLRADHIIEQPLLGQAGYWLFQLMTAGVCVLGVNGFLWGGSTQNEHGKTVSFSWLGFFLRDAFMGAVFTPFAILITRLLFVEKVTSKGLFADLGGWDAFSDPATPLMEKAILGGIIVLLAAVVLVLAFVPLWLFHRAFLNLLVILRRGNSRAIFAKDAFSAGEPVEVKILVDRPGPANETRRVFLNCLQAQRGEYPPSSKKYKRQYLYTDFCDFSVAELRQGISLELPFSMDGRPIQSDHQGNNKTRYWEILMEEPGKLHWARFFVLVK